MVDPAFLRAGLLFGPTVAVALLFALTRPAVAAMLAFLWLVPMVLLVNLAAFRMGWWRFEADTLVFMDMPIDVLIGWAMFWGPLPILMSSRVRPDLLLIILVVIDLVAMPLAEPFVRLGPDWLWGEALAIGVALFPALLLARLTEAQRLVGLRAALQAIGYGGWLLVVIPAAAIEYRGGNVVSRLDNLDGWRLALTPLLGLLLILGLAGSNEFARVGQGTPIPFDPPQRLVVTGA
jgi:hypothetical protein